MHLVKASRTRITLFKAFKRSVARAFGGSTQALLGFTSGETAAQWEAPNLALPETLPGSSGVRVVGFCEELESLCTQCLCRCLQFNRNEQLCPWHRPRARVPSAPKLGLRRAPSAARYLQMPQASAKSRSGEQQPVRGSEAESSMPVIKAGSDFKQMCTAQLLLALWCAAAELGQFIVVASSILVSSICAVFMRLLVWNGRIRSRKLRSSSVKYKALLLQAQLCWSKCLAHISNNSLNLPRKITLDIANSCQLFPP